MSRPGEMIVALSAGRDCPAEVRARLALDEPAQRELLAARMPGLAELVVLCTCHRTEIYARSHGSVAETLRDLAPLFPDLGPTDHRLLRLLNGMDAVEHLFRVACGLESLAIGEPQILGQVRRAYVQARQEGAVRPALSRIFDRAIRLGRRARSETSLGALGTSIGKVAAQFLGARLNGLGGRAGAVVGAGKAAKDVAQSLAGSGARLALIARNPASAISLCRQIGGVPHSLQEIPTVFDVCDFAVVAVKGGRLIDPDHLPDRRNGQPFLILDLSVPPAVETGRRAGIELHTLDNLPYAATPELTAAINESEALIKEELADFRRRFGAEGWVGTSPLTPSGVTA